MFSRIKKGYLNLPLVWKMVLMYMLVIALPMVLLSANFIFTIGHSLEKQYTEGKREALEQSADFIGNKLGIVEFCTGAIQYNSSLIEYIEHQDFSTADGVAAYLEVVRPAFEQLKSINSHFETIRVYRMSFEALNDIRYVLNREDQPNLEKLGTMNLRDLRLFFESEGEKTTCLAYKVLYNGKYTHQIGYTEVVSPLDELFGALGFFQSGESIYLTTSGGELYLFARNEKGELYLQPRSRMAKTDYCMEVDIPKANIRLSYCFERMELLGTREMLMCIVFVVTMLALLSVLFLLTYRSITRRIADFTNHLHTSKPLMPYEKDPYQDEIGQMIQRFNKTIIRQNQLTEEIYQKEKLVSQAQYYALQSQIQPHFLYNTLENIDMLIAIGQGKTASKMIALFGKILRYNVSYNKATTLLGNEMDHIADYLKLYSFRMSEDFRYSVELPEALRKVVCPYCMLQPLIENCFKHGFKENVENPYIHIWAKTNGDKVEVLIEDNGRGISEEEARKLNETLESSGEEETSGESVGLRNVNHRIRLLCGADCGLKVKPMQNGFAIVIELNDRTAEPLPTK